MKGDQIVEALKKHEKYVLLLVDEFDELYRVREGNSEVENIVLTRYLTSMSTLGDLMWLGNQKTGRFAVLLCGSSASCPLLITLNANKNEKYSILSQGIHEGVGEFSAFHYGNHESGVSLAGSPQLKFRDKLLMKMREKNKKGFEMIQDDVEGTVNAYKVMETNWIPHFQPLTISEVKSVWIELQCDQQQQLNTTESLEQFQQALIIDGLPSSVFPISAAQVFVHPHLDIHRPFIQSANSILQAEFQALKNEVREHSAKNIADGIASPVPSGIPDFAGGSFRESFTETLLQAAETIGWYARYPAAYQKTTMAIE
eukprot:gene22533-29177_t